jgi:phosphatidylserine/phosphatidylglycerophosphate/cardiolipin synthase-like enzyme/subtilisin family serine protease
MDPRLAELLQQGEDEDRVAVLVRLAEPHAPPPAVEVVSVFGDVATARMRRGSILSVRAEESVLSVKAAQMFVPEPDADQLGESGQQPALDGAEGAPERRWHDERRPVGELATGRGVVIGFIDWGCDFAHPDLRHPDGSTRLLALWDQRADSNPDSPQPWGYGIVHSAAEINHALAMDDPYGALRYNPADADPRGEGSHATHCMGIAAGNGRAGTPLGVAPNADLVFVHLSSYRRGSPETLADSVTLIEAVDFIIRTAADRPLVINLSIGAIAGAHDGRTLVERALDAAVTSRPGIAITQSTGNYFARPVHTTGRLRPGTSGTIKWLTDAEDPLTSEIEVWYPGVDVFGLQLRAPGGQGIWDLPLATQATLAVDGHERGAAYHRSHEPNNGQNHIQVFLYPRGPGGAWELELIGADISDGRFHCWVERAGSGPHGQSLLDAAHAVHTTTTNTICNGYHTIAVGAYDAHSPGREPAPFSSSGPTVDDRVKPDLLAPGVQVLSARSASGREQDVARAVRKSGTSMAAPHVAGTIALMFEVAGRPLPAAELRRVLLRSCDPLANADPATALRAGDGYLNTGAAVAAARRHPSEAEVQGTREDAKPGAAPDEDAWVWSTSEERTPAVTLQEVGQPQIDGSAQEVEIADWAPAYGDTDFDGALGLALSPAANHSVIAGDPLGVVRDQDPGVGLLTDLSGARGKPLRPARAVTALTTDRNPALARRLRQAIIVVAAPGQPLDGRLAAGDILLSRAIGEPGNGFSVVIADPALWRGHELGVAPGLYVAVSDPARRRDGRSSLRRVAHGDGLLLDGHVVVRRSKPDDIQGDLEADGGELAAEDTVTLLSPRFTSNLDLQAVAAGRLRLGAPGTAPYPAPVSSQGDGVRAVQQALLDLGYPLPRSGADGRFGAETGAAVTKYKTDKGIYPNDSVVGPHTIAGLDAEFTHPDPSQRYLDWFDTSQGMGTVHKGNAAQFYITGQDAFQALAGDLEAYAAQSAMFYLVGWSCSHLVPMRTQPPVNLETALRTFDSKGGQVRAMLWDNRDLHTGAPAYGAAETVKLIQSLPHGAAVLDRRTPLAGCHHQKIQAISVHRRNQNEEWDEVVAAYCGGMDLFDDRLTALHDVHCRVVGAAGADLIGVLHERWRDHPDATAALPNALPRPPLAPADGFDLAQVGRTYPKFPPPLLYWGEVSVFNQLKTMLDPALPTGDMTVAGAVLPYNFYPSQEGVQQVWRMVRHAIRRARRFIYVEEQYLVNTAIADELANKLKSADDAFMLIILIAHPDTGVDIPQVWRRRRDFINRLHRADPEHHRWRVSYRVIAAPRPYVHSKTWIFDDELVITGSANIDRRGYTYNSEAMIAVAGDLTGSRKPAYGAATVAQDLRCRLFATHLGGNPAQYLQPAAAFAQWFSGPQVGNTAVYDPAEKAGDPDPILQPLLASSSPAAIAAVAALTALARTNLGDGTGDPEQLLWNQIEDPDSDVPPPP